MEADRFSLYTDFPDIAYNVFFKRRMVVGFDADGLPIIGMMPVQNGTICHGDQDKITLADDYPEVVPVPKKGNEPFAYPSDYERPPFDYDPYSLWPEDSVPPPIIPEPNFDFPEIKTALRYRMPGRSHMQQVYPLQMFGYTEKIRGRTRKLLPLPVAIPIPKKLPKLMYRPPKENSLTQKLKEKFGIRSREQRDDLTRPLIDGRRDRSAPKPRSVPPLSYKSLDLQPPHRSKSQASVDRWSVRPHRTLAQRVRSAGRQLRAKVKGSPVSPMDSPRLAKSAVGMTQPPRGIAGFTSRMARSAGAGPRLREEDMAHPKPSRFVVPKTPPANVPRFPSRSMLKSADPSPRELRPATSFTGRKSVTIKEGDMITRPTTAVTERTGGRSTDVRTLRDVHLTPYHNRPWSSMYSTAGTDDPNIFDLDWVSSEYGGTSRPSTSMSRPFTSTARSADPIRRPKTPLIHPAPNIHGNIKVVTRTTDFNMLIPKDKLKFGAPPTDHTNVPYVTLPPVFKGKLKPQAQREPADGPRHLWQDDVSLIDISDDDDSLESTFFLTEVPEVRKNSGVGQKKPSPPPPYSEVNQMNENSSSNISNDDDNTSMI